VFCHEAVAEVAKQRESIESQGYQIALVYQGPREDAERIFARYRVEDLPSINDSSLSLYQSAGMGKGSWMDFLKPGLYARTLQALLRGYTMGLPQGDASQLGGVVLVQDGKISDQQSQRVAWDPLDFKMLTSRGSIGES